MIDTEVIVGEGILWAGRLIVLFFIWKIARNMKLSLSLKGWGTVRREFGIGLADIPANVSMQGVAVRVGTYWTDMARIGMDTNFVYLDRPLSSKSNGLLRIPFHRFELISPPSTSGAIFNLPGAGVFKVNGVEILLGSPFAERIIARLT